MESKGRYIKCITFTFTFGWQRDAAANIVGLINEVNQRRARLVFGWVTVFERVNRGM